MKSIVDDAKKWPELKESDTEVEPQGIYRPLYIVAKVMEEAVKAKLEPLPEPPKPQQDFRYSVEYDDNSRLARIAIIAEKCDPNLKGLLIFRDSTNLLSITLLLPRCPFCQQKHRHAVNLLDFYRSPNQGIDAIKEGIEVLKNMCLIELGPAGIQK